MALSDYNQECFICRLPDCDMTNERCGMVRGVKYELYPKSILKSPKTGISRKLDARDWRGFKERPAFTLNEGMSRFCQKVIDFKM